MKIRKEIIVGIVVIIAAVLLYFGFSFLKGNDIFKKGRDYYAVYNRVDGLGTASPVLYNGYHIGRVQNIYFSPQYNGRIVVMFNISNSVLKINKDAQAKIISSDLLGSKAIEIVLGKSKKLVNPGDTLRSGIEKSLKEEVNAQLLPLKNKTEGLISTVDSAVNVFAAIFNEDAREHLKRSFASIETSISTFEKTSKRMDTLVKNQSANISQITENVKHITSNINNNQKKLNNIIDNFSSISDTLAKAHIAETINNTKKALTQFTTAMKRINEGQGTIGQLAKNDTLYYNLQVASKNLDLLLKDMRQYPGRYVHFSIFGRKDKGYKGSGKVSYPKGKNQKGNNQKTKAKNTNN